MIAAAAALTATALSAAALIALVFPVAGADIQAVMQVSVDWFTENFNMVSGTVLY